MKIAIDTRSDSIEELQHAIDILSRIVSSRGSAPAETFAQENHYSTQDAPEQPQGSIFNLFNDEAPQQAEQEPQSIVFDEGQSDENIFSLFAEEQSPRAGVTMDADGPSGNDPPIEGLEREDFNVGGFEEDSKKLKAYF